MRAEARSRITNGRDLLPSVDGQSVWARIMRDTIHAMHAHLGGEDNVSAPQHMLARRVAAMEAELIHLEDHLARTRTKGKAPAPNALDLYSRMAGQQRRILEAIGLDRVPRDVTSPRRHPERGDPRWVRPSSSALARWRREPTSFIEQVMRDPETGKPFELLPAERTFLEHAFKTNDNGA